MGWKSKEGIYVFVQMIHFAVHQKLTHIVKQLYSNKKIKEKIKEAQPRFLAPSTMWGHSKKMPAMNQEEAFIGVHPR